MSSSQDHSDQDETDGIHKLPGLGPYANETERLAAVHPATAVGKAALQSDSNTYWILIAAPGTWQQFSGPPPIRIEATTARTLALTDGNSRVRFTNGSPVAATVPTNAVVPHQIGTTILLEQAGAGKVTVSGAGVTLQSSQHA